MPRILLSVLAALLAAASPATAQDPAQLANGSSTNGSTANGSTAPSQQVSLASPRESMQSFMINMRDNPKEFSDKLKRATQSLDLSGYTVPAEVGAKAARVLYKHLTDHNIHPDIFQDAAFVNGLTDYEAPAPGSIPIRFVRDDNGAWRVHRDTLDTLLLEYSQANPPITKRALDAIGLAPLTKGVIFGLESHLWIGIFLVIAVGVVVDLIARIIAGIIARRFIRKETEYRSPEDTPKLLRRSIKPFGLTAGGIAVYLLIDTIGLPADPEAILRTAARAFTLIAGVFATYRLVDLVAEYFQHKASLTEGKFDDHLVRLGRRATKVFVIAFGLLFLAESFHLPIASLVAGLGIGGLAFAFAAKDTIENLFGSVAVILDHPFSVGDYIVVEEVEGVVEELGFRSTRIRTFYNSVITVPNAILVRAKVDNYGRRQYRRFKTNITIAYGTPPETIEAFCEGIRELIRNHTLTRKDLFEVQLNNLGSHSLDILLYMFFTTTEWSIELRERHRLIMDIIRLAKDLNVEFAFPTQTIHLYNEENPPPVPPIEGDPLDAGASAAKAILERSQGYSG